MSEKSISEKILKGFKSLHSLRDDQPLLLDDLSLSLMQVRGIIVVRAPSCLTRGAAMQIFNIKSFFLGDILL